MRVIACLASALALLTCAAGWAQPGFSTGDQVDMARGLTLKAIQQCSGDRITDQILADIEGDFAKLAAKK